MTGPIALIAKLEQIGPELGQHSSSVRIARRWSLRTSRVLGEFRGPRAHQRHRGRSCRRPRGGPLALLDVDLDEIVPANKSITMLQIGPSRLAGRAWNRLLQSFVNGFSTSTGPSLRP